MQNAILGNGIHRKFMRLQPTLNERSRRLWAATEALELGWGGATGVARATGLAPATIRAGIAELRGGSAPARAAEGLRIRRPGGGRKAVATQDPGLWPALDALVEPTTRGDPEAPLRWTIKSTRELARELTGQAHLVSHTTVAALLDEAGFSLQATRKTREGSTHPDRTAQFE